MNNDIVCRILQGQPLFETLTESELQELSTHCKVKDLHDGSIIIKEGEFTSNLYLIKEGDVALFMQDPKSKIDFQIGFLTVGDYFGEISFYESDKPRACTIKAKSNCQVIEVDKQSLQHSKKGLDLFNKMKASIESRHYLQRLSETNSLLVKKLHSEAKLLQENKIFGKFFVLITCMASISVIFNHYLQEYILKSNNPEFIYNILINWVYLLVMLIPCLIFIYHTKRNLTEFGFSLQELSHTARDTLALMATFFVVFAGFILMGHYQLTFKSFNIPYYLWFANYLAHSTLQEFVSKGVLLTTLINVLGTNHQIKSILISSLVFATIHINFGFQAVILTFMLGCFLGVLYLKHKNIFGISVLHAVFGTLGFSVNLL